MKFALLGDLHGFFDDFDIQYFNNSDYDFLLFTGDVPNFFHLGKKIYSQIKRIEKKSFLIYGNHDGFSFWEVGAEIFRWESLRIKDTKKYTKRKTELFLDTDSNIIAGGYKIELLNLNTAIFLARPHSIGGNDLSFPPVLKEKYGVDSLNASFLKMKEVLNHFLKNHSLNHLIILSHNGPKGLGSQPFDLWGCDFNPDLGDFGDPDLTEFINYCKSIKIHIPFVVAGHMHHRLSRKTKKRFPNAVFHERKFFEKKDGIYFFNPAKVPRIFQDNNKKIHYHIFVEINNEGKILSFEEKFI